MFLWILILFFFSSLAIACSSSKKIKKTTPLTISATDSIAGLNVIKMSDCFTCHSKEERLTGPSFFNIATRYMANEDNIDRLAAKIIKGGKGSWGDLPMTPHISMRQEDAAATVKYILSLKK